MAQPFLTIDTEEKGEEIVIDGNTFHLTPFDAFSPADQLRLARSGKRLVDLAGGLSEGNAGEVTDAEIDEIEKITSSMFDKVAGDISPVVKEKLKPGAKSRIAQAYFLALGDFQRNQQAQSQEVSKSGPQPSSPASNDSTGEDRKTG